MLLYDQTYKYFVGKTLSLLQASQVDVVPGSFGFHVNVKVARVLLLAPKAMLLLASRNRKTVLALGQAS